MKIKRRIFQFSRVANRQLFYLYISFLDQVSTFIYKETYEIFQSELITKEHIHVITSQ